MEQLQTTLAQQQQTNALLAEQFDNFKVNTQERLELAATQLEQSKQRSAQLEEEKVT